MDDQTGIQICRAAMDRCDFPSELKLLGERIAQTEELSPLAKQLLRGPYQYRMRLLEGTLRCLKLTDPGPDQNLASCFGGTEPKPDAEPTPAEATG